MDTAPHSAQHLSLASRDFWWNPDFLDLMSRRWRLSDVRRVLDVGAGVGHWGRLLLPRCHPEATLTGLDREPSWVEEATRRAAALGLEGRTGFLLGHGEALPFPDGAFDLVTCQTLLLHVADPAAVLRELRRVAAPGGLVVVAEPINMAGSLVPGSTRFHDDVEDVLELLRMELLCFRGKERLGLGNNSIGALLPRLFREAGLGEPQVAQSDKVSILAPPYAGEEAQALLAEARASLSRGDWLWGREEQRRYYLAGGGAAGEFDALFERGLVMSRRIVEAYEAGTEFSLGAGCFILAWAWA
jgi:SAM-dependent methyltransferase